MSSESPEFKNKLLEWCQKNKYTAQFSAFQSGEDHNPIWRASIDINDQSGHKVCAIANVTSTGRKRISAEQQAAKELLECIEEQRLQQENKQNIVLQQTVANCLYLIDLENQPIHSRPVTHFVPESIYAGFVTTSHSTLEKYKAKSWRICDPNELENEIKKGEKRLLFTISGRTHDLADHLMSAYLFYFIEYIKKHEEINKIYVVTHDHAGTCVTECLKLLLRQLQVRNWEKIKIQQITTILVESGDNTNSSSSSDLH